MAVIGGVITLWFGGLLEYYGDVDIREYRWKGPVAAVILGLVGVVAVASVRASALPGWVRALGYLLVAAVESALTFNTSAHYYEARCQDGA